jgi:hypothetical protein
MNNSRNLRHLRSNLNKLLLLLLLSGCDSDDSSSKVISSYPGGNPMVIHVYQNEKDTATYVFKKYFDDGELMDSFMIVNSVKQGIRYLKNKKEMFYEFDEYKDGKLNGKCVRYNFADIKIAESYFANGLFSGPEYIYSNYGEITKYNYYTSSGNKQFRVIYNDSSDVFSGNGVVQVRYDTTRFFTESISNIDINIATPPNYLAKYSIVSFKGGAIVDKTKVNFKVDGQWIKFSFQPEKKGVDTLGFRWHYYKKENCIDSGQVILPIIVI